MDEFRDAYGKNTTPEAEYQNGYTDGYVAGKEDCADEIARLREALENVLAWQDAVDVCAPELGGLLLAMYRARAALAEQEKS
jgi:hypothetical protein